MPCVMAGVAAVEARLHLISKNDGTKIVKIAD